MKGLDLKHPILNDSCESINTFIFHFAEEDEALNQTLEKRMAMSISRRLLRSFSSLNNTLSSSSSSVTSSTTLHSIPNGLRFCLPSMDSIAFGKHESFLPCQRLSTLTLSPGADQNESSLHMMPKKKSVPTPEGEIGLKKDKLLPVTNFQNEVKGAIVLPGDVFDVPIRKDIIQRVVRWQLAKRQQGTHSTKNISEVSGTGRKPHPQKGTGKARMGSRRNNQSRGGGIVHGPKPRSHAIKLNKKVRRLGLKIALSAYAAEGKLHVFDDFEMPSHKTKNIVNWVKQMENCKKFLLVDGSLVEEKLKLATQNLHYVNVLPSVGLNVYSILLHDTLVMSRSALDMIVNRLRNSKTKSLIHGNPPTQVPE